MANSDSTIALVSADTRQRVATLRGHELTVRCVAFSPDGRTLASGGDDGTLRLWSVAGSQELCILERRPNGAIQAVAFSPDGHIMAAGGSAAKTGQVSLWFTNTGTHDPHGPKEH